MEKGKLGEYNVMFVNLGMVWIMLKQETHVQDTIYRFPKIPLFSVTDNPSHIQHEVGQIIMIYYRMTVMKLALKQVHSLYYQK